MNAEIHSPRLAPELGPGRLGEAIPLHTFLWKIASRCNLDCTYCYVYGSADQSWRRQPKLMTERVVRQTAVRMREHFESHGKVDARVILHGGEPLLGGHRHLSKILSTIEEVLSKQGIAVDVVLQSNGLLFSPEIGDLLLRHGARIGVSLDGPPEVNDRYRVDHRGLPTSGPLEEKLKLLLSDRFRKTFAGFLCVIDITADPIAVTDYLLSFQPGDLDFLFPLDNHDRRPFGKHDDPTVTPYADWLIAAFDHWWSLSSRSTIRIFSSLLDQLCGAPSRVESLGVIPVDLIVVETNGEIEGVDSLKSSFEGAARLGYNVFDHSFDTVSADSAIRLRQMGVAGLCQKCRDCSVVDICGGGYLPHRYSTHNGFDNPSIYSSDLEKLIRHLHGTLRRAIDQEHALAECV